MTLRAKEPGATFEITPRPTAAIHRTTHRPVHRRPHPPPARSHARAALRPATTNRASPFTTHAGAAHVRPAAELATMRATHARPLPFIALPRTTRTTHLARSSRAPHRRPLHARPATLLPATSLAGRGTIGPHRLVLAASELTATRAKLSSPVPAAFHATLLLHPLPLGTITIVTTRAATLAVLTLHAKLTIILRRPHLRPFASRRTRLIAIIPRPTTLAAFIVPAVIAIISTCRPLTPLPVIMACPLASLRRRGRRNLIGRGLDRARRDHKGHQLDGHGFKNHVYLLTNCCGVSVDSYCR